ncbi:transporter substrate-binding domain-containing protein [Rhizobium sp. CCGE531]|uniref:transporter substrate-binding domain-containing protein n=1 Tax=Rhizobium sp. CCGE531 TaxID=2364271 RepID=UPI000EAA6DD9|nr:transporter substrate-binding domain-containing protein [Rhizobium sp. CCGE531]AYG70585.1 amino acid ABC transporter substrate-binding protein [Rhizobium sp. CCGE531]
MNKFLKMLTAASSVAVASAIPLAKANAGEVLDRVRATKTLTVAVGTDWGPMSRMNDKHELDGDDVDIAKGVAKYLGVEVKFVTPAWDLITSGQWEGRWDLSMGQMTPTKERAEKLNFPAVYVWAPEVAVVHKDSKATTLSDLDGKIVGVGAGNVAESYANHNFNPSWIDAKPVQYQFTPGQVKTYGSSNVAFDDLRLGDGVRLDAVLGDDTVAREAIKSGYPIKVLGTLFYAPGAISILKGDDEFNDKIAAAVKSMKDDGTLSKMSIKWFGVDYSEQK